MLLVCDIGAVSMLSYGPCTPNGSNRQVLDELFFPSIPLNAASWMTTQLYHDVVRGL
jgi:hypothetical protein